MELLPDRLPWYVTGPLMGVCVVALYALANRPLGATTAYSETVKLARGLQFEAWRIWLLAGFFVGAFVYAILGPGVSLTSDYGTLGRHLPLAGLAILLLGAGFVMGFGARWSGGCTSGHGLRGSASLSPASLAATGTFMGTAIVVTAIVHFATGGTI